MPPAVQRWRLVVARAADPHAMTQRDLNDAWLASIGAAGLPLARTEGATVRPRISFGAPLPVGMAAAGELIDVVLTERWPAWRVREALEPRLPEGWSLVRMEDVWLGGPPLAGRVVAADYRVDLDAPVARASLAAACAVLLAAGSLPRERHKGDRVVTYDLRPLLIDLTPTATHPDASVRVRTRFHPELGTGRPEEVVAALADVVGTPLGIRGIVRERLLLVEDLDAADRPDSTRPPTKGRRPQPHGRRGGQDTPGRAD